MELRKDYILDRWVIISEKRGKRPDQFKNEAKPDPSTPSSCFFCPGHESETPPEIGRIEKDGRWQLRNFPNKFNFIEREGDKTIKTADNFFTYSNPYGSHEVIVETPDHSKQIYDLSHDELKQLFKVYAQRIAELSQKDEYVVVMKNHGRSAGTSIQHSHSQIMSLQMVPPLVAKEIEASHRDGRCLYCDIIKAESWSYRRVAENDSFVAFCPYASTFGFEVWVFVREHLREMAQFSEKHYDDLITIMGLILGKLKEWGLDFNYHIHYAPRGKDLHFHIEITPRVFLPGGFEIGSGIIVNTVPPENAAKFYRGEQ